MPRRDFGPGRTTQPVEVLDPIEFGLFGRDWRCVDVEQGMLAFEASRIRPGLPMWQLPHELAVFVRDCVVEREQFDEHLNRIPVDAETIADIAAWLVTAYAEQTPQPTADDLHSRIEAELGPQERAAVVKDEHLWDHIAAAGGQIGG